MSPPEHHRDAGRAALTGPSPALSAERWREVQRVVDGALDRPPHERHAYLAEACAADASLRTDAAQLLTACERAERASGLFGEQAIAFAAPLLADLAAEDIAGADERRATLADALRSALATRYAIEGELGHGGMATVFLARDLRHDRAVAVKVVEPNVAPGGARRFLQEIRTAAGLTHPHVLGVHDSGEADGLLYFVMPYVEGETLRARMAREGALPLGEAVRLLRELADALTYAHAQGIAHHDLKPENVLLSGGHAIVADFGIAKALAAATGDEFDAGLLSAAAVLGTPGYMAPEQALGQGSADHRADLYSLGVLAYEMLAGARPFGSSRAPVPAALPSLRARRPDVPPAVVALVTRLLARDPADRPQSAEAVLHALDGILVPPTGTTTGARRRVVAATATLLALAGAGGYAVWRADATSAERPETAVTISGGSLVPGRSALQGVAVVPFASDGGSPEDDYAIVGMADELAHALARLPGLRVAGRTSSHAFRGTAAAPQEIGRALNVAALVEGTVHRTGDRLRVAMQLVSTADGAVLWDSVFEGRTGGVLGLQDELARAVVAALGAEPDGFVGDVSGVDLGRGTTDQEAYDLYLRGRYHFLLRGSDNITRSIGYYRQAIARDPSFARAHAGLAMAYSVLPIFLPDPSDSVSARTMASAERAVALDSSLADAQIALGVALGGRLRLREELERYRAAVILDPSSVTGHHWLGLSLLNMGHTDEAIVELRHAAELDPLAPTPAAALSTTLLWARRFPESAAAARRTLALDSTFRFALWTLGVAQAFGGQPDSAVVTLERGARLQPGDPWISSGLLFAYAAAGRWADAQRLRALLNGPGGDPYGGAFAALGDMVFGDREPLVRLLSSEVGQRDFIRAGGLLGCNPTFDPLWEDARFRAAMRRLGVAVCPLARPWPLPTRPGA